ncbi:unnamed protein product [Rhizoctonia solani]|uniref:TPR and ankyrin repeat-containing protein 1 n=1 Tax=Rhizoctonia solani TaxID=456999 RepID=A0A8H2ZX66_9AGAM|nr:unnamed protein product [Rhizoctonia solani]
MFVTRSRVLAQHVESTYQGLAEFTDIAQKSDQELKDMAKQSREDPDRALVEFDTEVDLRADLPTRYNDLCDSHFPLFISFDKLCSLLEGDIRHSVPGQISSETIRSLIGFDEFLHNYWPSFRGATHGLEPNLVWSEIVGVIKGSQAAFSSKDGCLSREEYVEGLSQRQFSLLASVRAKVYSIFELYNKRKAAQYDTDEADRTRIILNNLSKILGSPSIDYLYVDEVQDNLMIDIYLLRKLAKSIDNVYWSGDSAQTITAGSLFRINDLKAFTYQDQAVASSPRSHRKTIVAPNFTTFDLNINFRSLSGIVCFARTLVQAIHNLFPQTIDLMEPEKAKHYGDPPVLFTNIQNEVGYFEKFLLGSSASNRVVFGAQQVILVRDAAAAEELDARLQGLCNVLPITDSKGLEFDDVLIYNFFSKSPAATAAWEYLSGTTRWTQPPPPVLCSELKMLYVAVTRARRRCWIWDSGELVSQLQTMWTKQGLVKTEPASKMIGQIAAMSSSKAQWSAKGREYFSHRLYKLASACFRQSGQINDAKLSIAYHLMSRAKLRRLRGDTPAARGELATAATQLVTCAQLPGIGNPKAVYFHAATCFQAAQKLLPATSAFVKAGRAKDEINMLFEAHDYKSATDLLVENREAIEDDVFEELRELARVYLFDHHEYKYIGLLFDSIAEKITYARQPKYRTQLKHMLAEHRRYDELAEEHLIDKKPADAAKYFIKSYQTYQNRSSIARAVNVATNYTESVLLVEGTYRKNDQDLAKALVEKVQPFASCASRDACLRIDLFHAYLCFDHVSIEMVRAWDETDDIHQYMRTLASYLVVKSNSWCKDDSIETLLEYLDILESFKAAIFQITEASRPCASQLAQKLLGFTPIEASSSPSGAFQALRGSLIAYQISTATTSVSGDDINAIVRAELPKRLHAILETIHTVSPRLSHIQPRLSGSIPAARASFWSTPATFDKDPGAKLLILSKIIGILDVSKLKTADGLCDYTTVGHQWLGRTFQTTHPTTGVIEEFGSGVEMHDNGTVPKRIQAWLEHDWEGLSKSGDTSADSITDILLHFLVRSNLLIQLSLNITWALPIAMPNSSLKTKFIWPLQKLDRNREFDRVQGAVGAMRYILDQNDRPDAAVMISFIETLVRDIIIHLNPARHPDFDGLLLPFSWARLLARKYQSVYSGCGIECLGNLFFAVKQVSTELRFGTPGRWLMAGNRISSAMVDLLNLRFCWCISLVVGHMDDLDKNLSLALDTLKNISSDEMPANSQCRNSTAAGTYHAFARVSNRQTALTALCQTFQHERLVLMQENPYRYHPAKYMASVQTVTCSDPLKLFGRLGKLVSAPEPGVLQRESSYSNYSIRHLHSDDECSHDEGHGYGFSARYSPEYGTPSDDGRECQEYWH